MPNLNSRGSISSNTGLSALRKSSFLNSGPSLRKFSILGGGLDRKQSMLSHSSGGNSRKSILFDVKEKIHKENSGRELSKIDFLNKKNEQVEKNKMRIEIKHFDEKEEEENEENEDVPKWAINTV